MHIKPQIPEPPTLPNVFEWIEKGLAATEQKSYVTPADIFYSESSVARDHQVQDARWDTIVPRTLLFQRLFRLINHKSTAVQVVESMQACGFTTSILDTLPEAILVPLQDFIALCQPHPPSTWGEDLLELIKRNDIGMILAPERHHRQPTSNILVSTKHIPLMCKPLTKTASNTYYLLGLQAFMSKRRRN